jgi:ATP-dependent DNA helicase PIF1
MELSDEQSCAFEQFKNGKNMFITGPGGTGKSLLIKTFVQHAWSQQKNVSVCAMTGCATVLLQNLKAKTLHSWSGIRLAKGSYETILNDCVMHNKTAVKNWKSVDILIIDEVSMMSMKIFELLLFISQKIRKTSALKGIQVIFLGDFYQLPPVGDPTDPTSNRFCFESEYWSVLFPPYRTVLLTKLFRQLDPIYSTLLNEIRVGILTEDTTRLLQSRVGLKPPDDVIITKLSPIRREVDAINEFHFNKLTTREYVWNCIIKTDNTFYLDSGKAIEPYRLEQCRNLGFQDREFEIKKLTSLCQEKMTLKIGAVVMLTTNLSVDDGLCNGSQGEVLEILENQFCCQANKLTSVVMVRFSNGQVVRIEPKFIQNDDYPSIIVGQLPLLLAWAITIHKVQGATLDHAIIQAGTSIFEYGQTYVALSRVRSLEGLYLSGFHPQRIKSHPVVMQYYETLEYYHSKKSSSVKSDCSEDERSQQTVNSVASVFDGRVVPEADVVTDDSVTVVDERQRVTVVEGNERQRVTVVEGNERQRVTVVEATTVRAIPIMDVIEHPFRIEKLP